MRLSVFGLDHVGAVTAGCLAVQGHAVIAVDADPVKVDGLARAVPPVEEPGLEALIREAVGSGRLHATTSLAEAVTGSALTSICAGTADRHGRPDPALILPLCEEIGGVLRDKRDFHAIVLRGALPPGAARGLVIPALERASGKRAGAGFGIGLSPHFLRPGRAIEDYLNPPAIILGVTDDETLARLREMDIALQAPERVVDLHEAEAMMRAGPTGRLTQRNAPAPAAWPASTVPA